MKKLILFALMAMILGACDSGSSDGDKTKFANPFGDFTIEYSGDDYRIVVTNPVDQNTFETHFNVGTNWNIVPKYRVTINGVDVEGELDSGAVCRWTVMQDNEIRIESGVMPGPFESRIVEYTYNGNTLSVGEQEYTVCHIDATTLTLVQESNTGDETPEWVYMKNKRITEL